ncbi:site-specific DNA-methyltransferase [Aliarcobacter butzleri]|uniref:site-specific DNA-methyltransferase n=1 Tax=Aliarcobacter butzleri TaxID=28197 RepID=UPI003AF73D6F
MLNLESLDIKNQKINELEKVEELKNIFPEIFEDGKLNIEKFKNILFDIKDEKTEHYSFNWNGKQDCYKIIKQKSNLTLKVDDDKTITDGNNVFIEGDNLEVLKLLQTSYHKKIKMIYIDPPYNKDKDFVYSDTWGDTITNYLIQTDQLIDEGYTSTKTSSTGRRHTNWLNMIYTRLWLSRNLLKDDGVIFVSIDDDEVHNLRKVMDEIYGEENFVAQIMPIVNPGGRDYNQIAVTHEYLLVYTKTENAELNEIKKDIEFKLFDKIGGFELRDLRNRNPKFHRGNRPNLFYSFFINPNIEDEYENCAVSLQKDENYKIEIKPYNSIGKESVWRWGTNKANENIIKDNPKLSQIVAKKKLDGGWTISEKNRRSTTKVKSIWDETEMRTEDGTRQIRALFGETLFDHPKPKDFLKRIIEIGSNENDIILDFFAGSGTTAHAVMELNQDDEKDGKVGNRKYILVQLPEVTEKNSEAYKTGYKKISDITKARIKKVIEKLDYKDGFKSYKLDSSNFQVFKELKKRPNDSFEDIVKILKMSVFNKNIFAQNAKEIDIVYEVGLKNGFSLSAKNDDTIKLGNYKFIKLFEETREFYFCFADKIELDIAEFIPKDAKLICFDKALDDSTKMNLKEKIDVETL